MVAAAKRGCGIPWGVAWFWCARGRRRARPHRSGSRLVGVQRGGGRRRPRARCSHADGTLRGSAAPGFPGAIVRRCAGSQGAATGGRDVAVEVGAEAGHEFIGGGEEPGPGPAQVAFDGLGAAARIARGGTGCGGVPATAAGNPACRPARLVPRGPGLRTRTAAKWGELTGPSPVDRPSRPMRTASPRAVAGIGCPTAGLRAGSSEDPQRPLRTVWHRNGVAPAGRDGPGRG